MADKIQLRRDSAADWASTNPVLASGEAGVELDTGKMKVGNGLTPWSGLPYVGDGSGGAATLNDLTDVNLVGPLEGSGLVYDQGNSQWIVGKPDLELNDLTDVLAFAPLGGHTLIYDDLGGTWTTGPAGGGADNLYQLNDVDADPNFVSDGQILVASVEGPGSVLWMAQDLNAAESLNDLTDVDLGLLGPANAGNILAYDGFGLWSPTDTFQGTATTARYADLAEKYASDADYEPGTVVVLGGSAEVTQSTVALDSAVAGVVSTDPAHLMNADLKDSVAVALRGRVPVKVVGQVRKGDILVTSDTPGHAQSASKLLREVNWAQAIGKSLNDKMDDGAGVVEVLI